MTQEDKELLLKDLCARLPYDVKVHINGNSNICVVKGIDLIVTDEGEWEYAITSNGSAPIELKYIKPYLRPMSSMSDEEYREIRLFFGNCIDELHGKSCDEQFILGFCQDARSLDILNQHHFDYRGLIDKGIALEAPEDMYKF